jgi:hypothetical protein
MGMGGDRCLVSERGDQRSHDLCREMKIIYWMWKQQWIPDRVVVWVTRKYNKRKD